jgi:hypothetical protein
MDGTVDEVLVCQQHEPSDDHTLATWQLRKQKTRRDSMVLLVRGQISSLDWYKIIWPYKLHQFARFGRQLAAIPFM